MTIDWTEQDLQRFATTYGREMGGGATTKEALAAVGSEAADLLVARGGTMSAEELRLRLAVIAERLGPTSASHLGEHIIAQGARIAALEARINADAQAARANIDGWRDTAKAREAAIHRLEQHISELEKSLENARNELTEVRSHWKVTDQERGEALSARDAAREELERTRSHLETVRKEREETAARLVAILETRFKCAHGHRVDVAGMFAAAPAGDRYPCSPTCTHDDAATPGHPERVRERSEAFRYLDPQKHYDDGAEAMRAACLEAVQREGQKFGLSTVAMAQFKAAIEGAAP